jgi:hypothetical protein
LTKILIFHPVRLIYICSLHFQKEENRIFKIHVLNQDCEIMPGMVVHPVTPATFQEVEIGGLWLKVNLGKSKGPYL